MDGTEQAGLVLPAGRQGALERVEARYRTIVGAFADYVFVTDAAGRLRTDMPLWRAVTGQSPEALLDFGWLAGVHPDDRARTEAAWAAAVAAESIFHTEYRIVGPGGERHLDVAAAPVRDAAGAIVEWIGTCTDVTDHRLAEAARAGLEADLVQERETLRRVVERTGTGVVLTEGPDHVVALYNQAFVDMVPAGRVRLGRPLADAFPEAVHLRPVWDGVLAGESQRYKELKLAFGGLGAFEGYRYYDVIYDPVVGGHGEPGMLVMTTEVTEDVRRRSDLERRLEAERRLGGDLQRALLPEVVPAMDALDLAVRYSPASDRFGVGGDWYDVLPGPDGTTTLVIGDVAGNGLAAATAMAQLRAAVRAHVLEGLGPADVLERASAFCIALELADMATAVVARLDPATGALTWANAGHPPPLLVPTMGTARLLWTPPDPPLGAAAGPFGEHVAQLPPDGALVLYTDGLVEQRRETLDDTLEELRHAARGRWSAAGDLRDAIARRMPGRGEDDVAMLVCRRPAGEHLHRRFAPLPQHVGQMRDLAAAAAVRAGFAEADVDRVRLATSEAATNAVVHTSPARPAGVELTAAVADGELIVVVTDAGTGVVPRPDSPGAGLGVGLIQSVSDRAEWLKPETGGTAVRMAWRLPGA